MQTRLNSLVLSSMVFDQIKVAQSKDVDIHMIEIEISEGDANSKFQLYMMFSMP